MKQLLSAAGLAAILLTSGNAFAAMKTVTLAVENMYCASCPYIVKQVLKKIPGVNTVDVSFGKKTATVTFDDSKTNVEQLTDATFDMGYPSELVREGS